MFSQFTQLASKFSLDNLQEESSDAPVNDHALSVSPTSSTMKSSSSGGDAQEAITALEIKLQTKTSELQSALREIGGLKRDIKEERERIDEYASELHVLEEEKQSWLIEKSQLITKIEQLEQHNKHLQGENDNFKARLTSVNDHGIKDGKVKSDDIPLPHQEEISRLQGAQEKLQYEIECQRELAEKQQLQLLSMQEQHASEVASFRESELKATHAIEQLTSENAALSARIKDFEHLDGAGRHENSTEDVESVTNGLKATVATLEDALSVLREQYELAVSTSESRIKALQEEIQRLNREASAPKDVVPCASCVDLTSKLQTATDDAMKKQQIIDDMRQKMSLVTEKMKDKLKENNKRQQELEEQVVSLTNQVQEKVFNQKHVRELIFRSGKCSSC